MSEAPFWADSFDLDLPKVFPEARAIMGELADVEMYACGKPDQNGKLNHPTVWNSDHTMLSCFGFSVSSAMPRAPYAAPGTGVVRCTAWEAFRDAWPHSYLLIVERRPIWDTFALRNEFHTILYQVRGYPTKANEVERARRVALISFSQAVRAFRSAVIAWQRHHGSPVIAPKAEPAATSPDSQKS